MGRNRMAAKPCPNCDQQVPVACKTCPCGFSFFAQRKNELVEMRKSESSKEGDGDEKKETTTEEENKPRRTERTKRLRPDFYNSVEIDKQNRKQYVRRRRALAVSGTININQKRRRAVMLRNADRRVSSKSNSIMDGIDREYQSDNEDEQDSNGEDGSPRKRKGRPKYNKDKNGADQEEAIYENLSVEKVFQYSVILADINRKISIGQSMNRENVTEQSSSKA